MPPAPCIHGLHQLALMGLQRSGRFVPRRGRPGFGTAAAGRRVLEEGREQPLQPRGGGNARNPDRCEAMQVLRIMLAWTSISRIPPTKDARFATLVMEYLNKNTSKAHPM